MASEVSRAVEAAAWLTKDVLMLVLRDDGIPDADVQVSLDGAGSAVEAPARRLPAADTGAAGRNGDERGALLAVAPIADRSQLDLSAVTLDLKALLRRWLAPLDARGRDEMMDFLAYAAMRVRPSARTAIALAEVRDTLRERLLPNENASELPRGLAVEHILKVDDRSVFIKGWVYDHEAEITRLTAVSPEGMRVEILQRYFHDARPDVAEWSSVLADDAKVGLICTVELPAPSLLRSPWVIEFENADGAGIEITAPAVEEEDLIVRAKILSECSAENRRILEEDLMARHLIPAITRLQEKASAKPRIQSVIEYGEIPASPDVSIVIPLYRNIDFLEAQLAEFADDPDIHASEIIYVLDSPELEDELDYTAASLYPIYQVPMRILVLEKNVGFANANNAGASFANGRLLLLMNSDVLPDKPGWLSTMRDFYDSKESIGALAPKLIYEDESIQHAGMHFTKRPGSDTWSDSQYYKGLHRTFPAANVTRTVPAVTGACLMIDRGLYEEFGGLSGHYVQGDYEDFDLCMRLIESGRENWYLPEAELYHLEAQSYTPELRLPSNRYNAWLHTHRWTSQIEILVDDRRTSVTEGVPVPTQEP